MGLLMAVLQKWEQWLVVFHILSIHVNEMNDGVDDGCAVETFYKLFLLNMTIYTCL